MFLVSHPKQEVEESVRRKLLRHFTILMLPGSQNGPVPLVNFWEFLPKKISLVFSSIMLLSDFLKSRLPVLFCGIMNISIDRYFRSDIIYCEVSHDKADQVLGFTLIIETDGAFDWLFSGKFGFWLVGLKDLNSRQPRFFQLNLFLKFQSIAWTLTLICMSLFACIFKSWEWWPLNSRHCLCWRWHLK